MSELSERLKREIDLRAHLVGSGVKLSGKMARCLFHDDTETSLSVNFADGAWVWHCFGCGEGGSIIDFEMSGTGSRRARRSGAWRPSTASRRGNWTCRSPARARRARSARAARRVVA